MIENKTEEVLKTGISFDAISRDSAAQIISLSNIREDFFKHKYILFMFLAHDAGQAVSVSAHLNDTN